MTNRRRQERRDQLDALVHSDSNAATAAARVVLNDPLSTDDDRAMAWTVLGRVLFGLGHHRRAAQAMHRALTNAERGSDAEQQASTRISAAAVFAEVGELELAETVLTEVEQRHTGLLRSRALAQHGYVLLHRGRHRQAIAILHQAEAEAVAAGDRLGGLRIVVNRSVAEMQSGQLAEALADLAAAEHVASELGQHEVIAGITGNRGVVEARLGRLGEALETFDRAVARLAASAHGGRIGTVIELDRAEALERMGEWEAALASAEHARRFAVASGSDVALGDADLAVARAYLAAGNNLDGHAAARRAVATLREGRPAAALQARALELQSILRRTRGAVAGSLGRAIRLDRRLRAAGAEDHADELLGACWHTVWRLGAVDLIDRLPSPSGAQRVGQAAMIRQAIGGDVAAALATAGTVITARRGARVRAGSGAVASSGRAAAEADIAEIATRLTLDAGRPLDVLRWAQFPDRSRTPRAAALAEQLDGGTWVRLVETGDELWAVVVAGRHQRIVRVGPSAPIEAAAHTLLDAVTGASTGTELDPATRRARADLVDRLVLAPLELGGDGVVLITPQRAVRNVAWGALPSLADRPHALIPGSLEWLEGSPLRRSIENRATLLIGPNIAAAATERRSIGAYRTTQTLSGGRATQRAAGAALADRGVVQIAAHGDVRADRPGRSALELADGPLSVLDLRHVAVGADLVMLTCCSVGASPAYGRDTLSLAGTLVRRGAASVIAPVAPVDERSAAQWAAGIHRAVAAGATVGEATVRQRAAWLSAADPRRWSAAAGFTLTGSPSSRLDASPNPPSS